MITLYSYPEKYFAFAYQVLGQLVWDDQVRFITAAARYPSLRAPWRRDDPEKAHFVIQQIATLSRDQFSDAVRLSRKKTAFIFVHGYWNSFSDPIFRLAQIVYDTNISAVPVAFCWPSMGSIDGYGYDRDSAVFSKGSFTELLELLHKEAGITSIYVVAHSMGNQIVADTLAYARLADIPLPVSEIAFAAPDVDQDVFSSQVKRIKEVTPGIGLTLYASSADKLLSTSKLQSSRALVPRAGDVPDDGPVVLTGMDTIDVTSLGDDIFGTGHSTFSQSRSVIDDIGRLMTAGTRPPHVRSPQLRKVPEGADAPRYWRYPQ